MKYMVMECHPGYAVLLDEEGRFRKAANLRYEVGQTVEAPFLMKERQPGLSILPGKRWISAAAAMAACAFLFFGFRYYQNYMYPYSSIYLTINPEVLMELNRQGNVVRLSGTNEDGRKLLEGYSGRGKDKLTVADELIDRAIDMGFLSEGGQVSFYIDAPDEALFQEYGVELRTEITEHLDGRITITLEIMDSEYAPETAPAASEAPSRQPETPPAAVPLPQDDVTDYQDTDYGADSGGVTDDQDDDGVTDDQDTDYGTDSGGVTDDQDTDYGTDSGGVTDDQDDDDITDYQAPSAPPSAPPVNYTDGDTDYDSFHAAPSGDDSRDEGDDDNDGDDDDRDDDDPDGEDHDDDNDDGDDDDDD